MGINLIPGAQFSDPKSNVMGVRVSTYGENRNVYGLDLGFFGNVTTETFGGVAVAGLINSTGKEAYVILFQVAGLANLNHGKAYVTGFQIAGLANTILEDGVVRGGQISALTNYAPKTDINGFQLGLYNRARKVSGFQVGLINYTDDLHGFQVGLVNINGKSTPFYIMPVLNVGF